MRLLLVRHAEAEQSAWGRCYGSLDVGLSTGGHAQAEVLASVLEPEPVEAVVSSPRRRAVDTATPIAHRRGLEVEIVPDLRELDFGELEGRTYDEIAGSLPELYAAWMTHPTGVRFPGGESYAELRARSVAAVAVLRRGASTGTVVVVTHGGVVRSVLADVLGLPDERIFRLAIDPASLTTVEWLGDEPVVTGVNRSVGPTRPCAAR
jgi:alpha-ribazole phosphatase